MIEAPTPLIIKDIVEFSSTTDKQSKINMKLIPSSFELEFSAKIIDKIPQKEYFVSETVENLLKNSYLATGGNILGILKILEYFIKKNSYKIYEENNLIKLQIDIEHPIIKFINFTLEEKKSDINTQVTELSSYVYETLVNKIKSLEEKNKDYENKIKEMKNEYEQKFQKLLEINQKNENKINELENIIKGIKNELPSQKENMKEQNNFFSVNNNKTGNSRFNSKIKINES